MSKEATDTAVHTLSNLALESHVMSPEGVEECVKFFASFTITLTQGGVYRLYDGSKPIGPPFVSLKAAKEQLTVCMAFRAMLESDPKKAFEALLSSTKRKD